MERTNSLYLSFFSLGQQKKTFAAHDSKASYTTVHVTLFRSRDKPRELFPLSVQPVAAHHVTEMGEGRCERWENDVVKG